MITYDVTPVKLTLEAWQSSRKLSKADPRAWEQAFATAGYQRMIRHAGLQSEEWLEACLVAISASLAGTELSAQSSRREALAGVIPRFLASNDLAAQLPELESNLPNVLERAEARARAYLPDIPIDTTVRFVISGAGDAFAPAGEIIINLAQIPIGNQQLLEKAIGHELHHIGFFSLHGDKMPTDWPSFQHFMISEGLAMQTMMPLTPFETHYWLLWQRHMSKHDAYLAEYQELCESDTVDFQAQSFQENWILSVGKAYYLGQQIVEQLEQKLGRQALIALIAQGPGAILQAHRAIQ